MARRVRSRTVSGPAAIVDGRGAFVLARVLAGSLRGGLKLRVLLAEIGLGPVDVEAAIAAASALADAGEAWREERRRFPLSGNAETSGSGGEAESVDVSTAALLLRVTPERVRQLARAGDLDGTRTSRGWLLVRSSVVDLCERREGKAAA